MVPLHAPAATPGVSASASAEADSDDEFLQDLWRTPARSSKVPHEHRKDGHAVAKVLAKEHHAHQSCVKKYERRGEHTAGTAQGPSNFKSTCKKVGPTFVVQRGQL